MGILWGIIGTLLGSISAPFWKKSLNMTEISNYLFTTIGNLFNVLVVIVFLFLWFYNIEKLTWTFVLLICLATVIFLIKVPIMQNIYKKEKISALMPYENLNKIITVIISFLFLSKLNPVSSNTFYITLIAIWVIIGFTVDWKNMVMPKSFRNITIRQWLQSIHTLIVWIAIGITSDKMYFMSYVPLITIVMMLVIMKNKELKVLSTLPKSFYKNRIAASITWSSWFIIWLFLISKYGIIVSTLLSFIGMGMTMVFSFFIIWEKPAKKDILLTVIVSSLVGLGFFLK